MFGISFHLYLLIHSNNESGAPIAMKVGSGETYFFEKNAQGDVVALFNESGREVARITYDAYGNTVYIDNPGNLYIPFRYRGYYYDEDTDFYYLQSRYYDPATGRFLNIDSIRFIASSNYNLFTYCLNNPVRFIDLNGYMVSEWDKAHLDTQRLYVLDCLTKDWYNATSDSERKHIHELAVKLRTPSLSSGQYVDDCGFVRNSDNEYVISMTFYNSYIDYTISKYVIRINLTQKNINDFVDDNSAPYFILTDLTQHMLDNYLLIYRTEFPGRTARGLASEINWHYDMRNWPLIGSHARTADLESSEYSGDYGNWWLFE